MYSRHKEGDDGVVDVILTELKMVTDDAGENDLVGFVEGLDSEEIVLVEVAVLEGLESAIGVELLEPLGLLGVDHGVLGEHHEESSVEGLHVGLAGGVVSIGSLLVVEVSKENGSSEVLFVMGDVTEVAGGSNEVLDEAGVNEVASNGVNDVADEAVEAVGDVVDSHVRSTDGGPVADLALDGTALDDVTSEEGTLGKSHDVDLVGVGESLVSLELGASLLGLVHEVVGHGGDGTIANLKALGVITGAGGDLLAERVHTGVDASITESMKDGGWDGGNGGDSESSSER